jgi:hypothetical protein
MTSREKFWLSFLFIVLVAVVFLGLSGMTWTDIRHIGDRRNALIIDGETIRIPLPEDSDGRVLPEVAATTSGDFSFLFEVDGVPVRWDPCRPISYVINPDGAPPGGEELILQAIDRVSAATGLEFDFEGYSSEAAPYDGRSLIREGVNGDEFVPSIIGWSNAASTPDLEGTVAGMGGVNMVSGAFGEQEYLVGGFAVLDAEGLASIMASSGGPGLVLAVIMHEIGHMVGLYHVDNPTELMNPSNESLMDWGPGDLAGLAIAGAGPCQTV